MVDSGTVQHLQKWLWYTGQDVLYNPLTERYVDARSMGRDELLGDHPAVTECIRFGEVETVRFDDPVAAGGLPTTIADRPREVRSERPFVCELRDVQLVGPDALSITPEGDVVLENALGYGGRIAMGAARAVRSGVVPKRGRTRRRYDVGLSLAGPWCTNYYHWLVDYVTRLRAVPAYVEATGREPVLLLPRDAPEWMRVALRLAGFDEEDWVTLEHDRTAVDRLVVPSLPRGVNKWFDVEDQRKFFGTSPGALAWLRQSFRSNLPQEIDVDAPERIYVTRETASERRVENRDALEDVLAAYGFEPMRPESYSLPQQVAIFSDAEVVMGPTGAGMVNAVFADDCSLITLYGSDTHPIYYVLGSLLDFDLGCVQCDPVGPNLVVDPDDLRTVLDGLGLG